MITVKPSIELLDDVREDEYYKKLEARARICYKSEGNISENSAVNFLRGIIKRGHESVLEHEKLSFKIVCDRGVSHEIVRHRLASYSQESTRYCNYSMDKFNNEITFIEPIYWDKSSDEYKVWEEAMENAEKSYFKLLELGSKPEEARAVLPNSLKTELILTMNIRALRHFLKLRTSKAAHPQMREVAEMILVKVKNVLPILFEDIE